MPDYHEVPLHNVHSRFEPFPKNIRKLALFAFSRQGLDTARRIREGLRHMECRAFAPARLAAEDFETIQGPLADFTGPLFHWADALIFVSSCGIAVRAIAPHIQSKDTDPAVLAMDETARFVVPLLSGHIGGANQLARCLSMGMDATAVVTTATDANGKFSVDAWAAEQGLHIDSLQAAKAVSAAILEGPVGFLSDFPVAGELPPGLVYGPTPGIPGMYGSVGILVSCEKDTAPFDRTLLLVPKVVRLGIGCRRGTPEEAVQAVVDQVLEENEIHLAAVKCAATIDLKKDEPGLLDFCRRQGWPLEFYSAEDLNRVEGDFTPSDFVRSVTGVDNVCERAALLGGEKLIIKKTARDGVTVAAAVGHWEAVFSES